MHTQTRTHRHTRTPHPGWHCGSHTCALMGRCGGGHGDSADVQPSERYRPHMQRVSGTGSSAQTACRWLVCMHVREHSLSPPAPCACACIAVREPRTQPVPSDRGRPAAPTCPRHCSPCCAAFALGSTSSTACPASYGKLVMAGACEAAARAVGLKYGGSGAYSSYPYGCYWHTITGSVYYNSNSSGAANVFAQALCSGAAPTSTPALAACAADGRR